MRKPRVALVGWFVARLARLRFPVLFLIAAALFVLDLAVPDVIPFADEVLLGLATALLASWRARAPDGKTPRTSERAARRRRGSESRHNRLRNHLDDGVEAVAAVHRDADVELGELFASGDEAAVEVLEGKRADPEIELELLELRNLATHPVGRNR
jgi:hypothetical protein